MLKDKETGTFFDDGNLILSGASKRIESLLMVTQLITVFPHYKIVEEAVTAYEDQG